MCAIVGAVLKNLFDPKNQQRAQDIVDHIWKASHERGRDGRGWVINSTNGIQFGRDVRRGDNGIPPLLPKANSVVMIGNLRAEPTTEFVAEKDVSDQQPYSLRGWHIVHNGTIANDKVLRSNELDTKIDSAAIVEQIARFGDHDTGPYATRALFTTAVEMLHGSYAILAHSEAAFDTVYAAANYRPIWYAVNELGVFFASARHYFPAGLTPVMLEPYTAAQFNANGVVWAKSLYRPSGAQRKALVVCSGGMDSVVAATWAVKQGYTVELLHFRYGSRAQGPEASAIWKVANYLGVGLRIHYLNNYSPEDSPLLRSDSEIAGGEEGAEFAHEWVPARNLVMLATATALAEANGFDTLVLGNNLEEAGAYPDNEPEFIARFNDLLPFAVGDGKRMRVIMPVGNLMKHEIVALGNEIGAPMHLTWSCYRAGELHCGTCGPCYMRRKAFEINGLPEVIEYKESV